MDAAAIDLAEDAWVAAEDPRSHASLVVTGF
jgi:hypothetical protein